MLTELFLALRFLREGKLQTLLILSGVGVGVGVVVFLSGLIAGLQASLIDKTLGAQAHLTIEAAEEEARPLSSSRTDRPLLRSINRPYQRLRSIPEWQSVAQRVANDPAVSAVAPVVEGPAFATRAGVRKAVRLTGIRESSFGRVIPIERRLRSGRFDVSGTRAIVGSTLATQLGVSLGDRIRLSSADGRAQLFVVAGTFDIGNEDANERWVLVSLRAGQTLLGLVGGVSRIEATIFEIFEAEQSARRIEATIGLPVKSWMSRNEQLLIGLRSQNQSSNLIQIFVAIAVAMGIASVLAVSVVQRAREIGILRAMGARRSVVSRIFLWQGGLLGLIGSAVGCGLGYGLAVLFASLNVAEDGSPLFPIDMSSARLLSAAAIATITGLMAAVTPARRAASLDPAVAMRSI